MDAAQAISFPAASLHDRFQGQAILGVLVLFLTHSILIADGSTAKCPKCQSAPLYFKFINLQAMLSHIRT